METKDSTLIYAIGDIHGRADLLKEMLAAIEQDQVNYPAGHKHVIPLGDYVDRGPDSREVIELLITRRIPGFQHHALRGNHDERLCQLLTESNPAWAEMQFSLCLYDGAASTFSSYGIAPIDPTLYVPSDGRQIFYKKMTEDINNGVYRLNSNTQKLIAEIRAKIPSAHLNFLLHLSYYARFKQFFFVHAGVSPGRPLPGEPDPSVLQVEMGTKELDPYEQSVLLTIRDGFLDYKGGFDAIIVHGHVPYNRVCWARDMEGNLSRIGIDTAAYECGVLSAVRIYDGVDKLTVESLQVRGQSR
ncbi:MAG: metallophosphoesterase [Dongiaceae bacterium]